MFFPDYHVFFAEEFTLQELPGCGSNAGLFTCQLHDDLGQNWPLEAEMIWNFPFSQVPEGPDSLHLCPKGLEQLKG